MRGAGGSQLLGWVGKMWRASSQTREGSFCRRLIRQVTVHLTKDVLGDLGRALTYEKGFKKPKNSQRGTVQADEITEVCWAAWASDWDCKEEEPGHHLGHDSVLTRYPVVPKPKSRNKMWIAQVAPPNFAN